MNLKTIDLINKTEESMILWLLQSGVIVEDGDPCSNGGVHAGYDTKEKQWQFIYSEITGYNISMFCMLYKRTGEKRYLDIAMSSASFLLRHQYSDDGNFTAGSFPEGLNYPDLSRRPRCYSFDTAICIQGLLDLYRITRDKALLKSADRAGKWILTMQDPSGYFFSYFDPETGSKDHPGPYFYEDAGCLHAKHAIALLKLYEVTGDQNYQVAAKKVCDWVLTLQDEDGSFWVNPTKSHVYAHAHSYATEGLLFAFELLKDPAYGDAVRRACNWLEAQMDHSYGILGSHKFSAHFKPAEACTTRQFFQHFRRIFPRKEIAADATVQSARLFSYLALFGSETQRLDKIRNILSNLFSKVLNQEEDLAAKGGLHSRLDMSLGQARPSPIIATWGVLFALQASLLLEQRFLLGDVPSAAEQLGSLF